MRGRKPKKDICRVCGDPIVRDRNDGKLTHERICKLCHGERILKQQRKNSSLNDINFQIKKYKRLIKILTETKEEKEKGK